MYMHIYRELSSSRQCCAVTLRQSGERQTHKPLYSLITQSRGVILAQADIDPATDC